MSQKKVTRVKKKRLTLGKQWIRSLDSCGIHCILMVETSLEDFIKKSFILRISEDIN